MTRTENTPRKIKINKHILAYIIKKSRKLSRNFKSLRRTSNIENIFIDRNKNKG